MKKVKIQNKYLKKVYVFLCYLFIIITPSYKCFEFEIGGSNIVVFVSILVILFGFVLLLLKRHHRGNYFSTVIFVIIVIEMICQIFRNENIETGLVICLLLYILFLNIEESYFSLSTIYICFYISTIIAAMYSVILGLQGSAINRVATSIDGSIAVICISITLFGKCNSENKVVNKVLRVVSFFAALAVAGFGMSRSRILMIGLIIILWLAQRFIEVLKLKEKIRFFDVLSGPILIIAIIFVYKLPIVQEIANLSLLRFEDGFISFGRDEEIMLGLSLVKMYPIIGVGWGTISFVDYLNYTTEYFNHCMYVAIIARGGIFAGVAFLCSFVGLLKDTFKFRGNSILVIVVIEFFMLGYGNSGFFNYTICSFMILIKYHLSAEKKQIKNNKKR